MVKKTGVFLLTAVVLWLALEAGLRLYFSHYFLRHPLLCKNTDIKGLAYVHVGLRPDTFRRPKTKPRILILGDYVSLHPIVAKGKKNSSYPQILAQKLAGSYEVINGSALYYSLAQEMTLFEHAHASLSPEIVIIGHVFNDLYPQNPEHITVPLEIKKALLSPVSVIGPALRYMEIKRHDRAYAHACLNPKEVVASVLRDYQDPQKLSYLRQCLDRLKELSRQGKCRVIFVVIPIFYDFQDTHLNAINDIVIQECRRRNIPFLDLLSVFKKYPLARLKEDDGDLWHQSQYANQIIADRICAAIISREDALHAGE